jgi:small subunit ribosomal protein S6
MRYELFYLVGASKEAELEKIKSEVTAIVTAQGGVFEEKETLEKRRMAYEIKHETHGIYTAKRFKMDSEKINEVVGKLNLHTGVLRFVISRADELPELRSKEERIADAERSSRESSSETTREEKEAPRKVAKKKEIVEEKVKEKEETREEASGEKKEEKSDSREDIDKKLEEILNI